MNSIIDVALNDANNTIVSVQIHGVQDKKKQLMDKMNTLVEQHALLLARRINIVRVQQNKVPKLLHVSSNKYISSNNQQQLPSTPTIATTTTKKRRRSFIFHAETDKYVASAKLLCTRPDLTNISGDLTITDENNHVQTVGQHLQTLRQCVTRKRLLPIQRAKYIVNTFPNTTVANYLQKAL